MHDDDTSAAGASSSLSARVLDALPGVDEMFADVAAGPPFLQPSEYWRYLNAQNLAQLEHDGFERFKRSINQNYFAFVPTGRGDDQYDAAFQAWLRHPVLRALSPRRIDTTGLTTVFAGTNPLSGTVRKLGHARYLAMLWELVRRRDSAALLDRLDEPELGAPIAIRYRSRRISQDLCNSVNEFYSATQTASPPPCAVLEIGGGYGRLAWVFLHALPYVRYVLCDIPPALAVAQRYLTTLFPDRPSFRFRPFGTYQSIADEFESARIAFITPRQLELLPTQSFDLALNVSSFHEMRPDQLEFYFGELHRHCAGYFYTKQWRQSINERDGLVLRPADYPVPREWTEIYSRPHQIQTLFFEALYHTRS